MNRSSGVEELKVTYQTLLEKMEVELLKAKQADNPEKIHHHLYSIKTLAEVMLTEKAEKNVHNEKNIQAESSHLNVDHLNNKEKEDHRSILDF